MANQPFLWPNARFFTRHWFELRGLVNLHIGGQPHRHETHILPAIFMLFFHRTPYMKIQPAGNESLLETNENKLNDATWQLSQSTMTMSLNRDVFAGPMV